MLLDMLLPALPPIIAPTGLLVIVCIIIIIVQEIIKRKEHKEKINNRKNELESKKFNSAIFNYYNQIYINYVKCIKRSGSS